MTKNDNRITINRAPVLTLWAAVVAERTGYNHAEALTLAKAVAGLNAQSKGQRLGIYQPSGETRDKAPNRAEARGREEGDTFMLVVLGRPVPAVNTDEGIRATVKGKPISPGSVQAYLKGKFGDNLPAVQEAMQELARAYKPSELASRAYALYEEFRPEIPEGARGWGAKGVLDLDQIRSLAKQTK